MILFSPKQYYPYILCCFGLAIFYNGFGQKTEAPWVYKNNKDDVEVWYRKTSDVHEVKAIAEIDCKLSGIILLFSEVEKYAVWGYKVKEANLVRRFSETEMIYHTMLDFPWPMNDRDIVMHTVLWQNPETRVITATSVAEPEHVSENEDIVRIKNARTQWTLTPVGAGKMKVEYYIYSNPGGKIPDWLVNLAIDVGPRETIKSIKRILKMDTYQKAKLSYIKD